jgi:hypothetical protein
MALLFLTSDGKLIMNSSKQVYTDNTSHAAASADMALSKFTSGKNLDTWSDPVLLKTVISGSNRTLHFSSNMDLQLCVETDSGIYHFSENSISLTLAGIGTNVAKFKFYLVNMDIYSDGQY